jgi:hypothetical protein
MGLDGRDNRGGTQVAGAAGVVEGIARFAGSVVELPAVQARCLPADERGRLADCLADAWNLAAFTETGAVLLSVLDAGGATIELVEGVDGEGRGRGGSRGDEGGEGGSLSRATSHGATAAAWGAPPGRRVAAMGLVPGPGGTVLRMSVGLVLRLPTGAITDPVRVAALLAWHAALHAAERRGMPCDGTLAAGLDAAATRLEMPRGPRGRVAWARGCAERVVAELALA